MSSARRVLAAGFLLIALWMPLSASAANVFGGKVGAFFPCFNIATYNVVGSPRGGPYIYIPGATRMYPDGPPGPGRWTLGLYGIPYFCIVLIFPLYVLPGITMTVEASSH